MTVLSDLHIPWFTTMASQMAFAPSQDLLGHQASEGVVQCQSDVTELVVIAVFPSLGDNSIFGGLLSSFIATVRIVGFLSSSSHSKFFVSFTTIGEDGGYSSVHHTFANRNRLGVLVVCRDG